MSTVVAVVFVVVVVVVFVVVNNMSSICQISCATPVRANYINKGLFIKQTNVNASLQASKIIGLQCDKMTRRRTNTCHGHKQYVILRRYYKGKGNYLIINGAGLFHEGSLCAEKIE